MEHGSIREKAIEAFRSANNNHLGIQNVSSSINALKQIPQD